jgi:hypothetical protein
MWQHSQSPEVTANVSTGIKIVLILSELILEYGISCFLYITGNYVATTFTLMGYSPTNGDHVH